MKQPGGSLFGKYLKGSLIQEIYNENGFGVAYRVESRAILDTVW